MALTSLRSHNPARIPVTKTASNRQRFVGLSAVCGWLLTATLWSAGSAFALPVGSSSDTRPAPPELRPHWKTFGVDASLSGVYLGGNAQFATLSGGLDLNFNHDRHQYFLNIGNLFTQVGNQVTVNRHAASLLYAYGLQDNVNLYAYTTHSRDQSILLNYRATEATGVCLHHLGAPLFSNLLVSLGPTIEHAWFQDGAMTNVWRADARLYGAIPVSSTTSVGADVFYRPAFHDITNLRLYGEAFVRVKMTDGLSLQLSAADEYDTRPRPGVLNNDFGIFTTLRSTFGW